MSKIALILSEHYIFLSKDKMSIYDAIKYILTWYGLSNDDPKKFINIIVNSNLFVQDTKFNNGQNVRYLTEYTIYHLLYSKKLFLFKINDFDIRIDIDSKYLFTVMESSIYYHSIKKIKTFNDIFTSIKSILDKDKLEYPVEYVKNTPNLVNKKKADNVVITENVNKVVKSISQVIDDDVRTYLSQTKKIL